MSAQELENRRGCNRRVIMFFVFAVACVVAFLIVGLVKTCKAEHEEKEVEEQVLEQETSMLPNESIQLLA